MREAKSLQSRIQMDMASREEEPLKRTAPTASFQRGGVPCLAVISNTQHDTELQSYLLSITLLTQTQRHTEKHNLYTLTPVPNKKTDGSTKTNHSS